MKKLLIIALLFVAFQVNAQSKTETKAKALVEKMATVITLSEKEAADIVKLEVDAAVAIAEVRKVNAENEVLMKEEVKKLNRERDAKVKAILGDERSKKWNDYKVEERKKKEQ